MEKITKAFLADRIAAGATHKDLVGITGLGRRQVYDLLAHHGLSYGRRGAARKLPPLAEIVRRIEAGEHPRDIAAESGVTTSAVHVAVKKKGLSVADIREGRHLKRTRRPGRCGFPDYVFGLRPGHGLGGSK
ncbi:hypothetical protein [Devosia salina]|uniref:Helix-turn-helix domain-containing protein n=1 Tax=Devosia salina TaxID=2860336 RepID=A0ABX8WPH5_9HYPH|nr:hypothetical protein [Devosia salina]QYO78395.1 hypothetical protein K1X15_07570 [Devosia salina]